MEEERMGLTNYKNYGFYEEAVKDLSKRMIIYVPEAITKDNIIDHIYGITNILKDGIETEEVHNLAFRVSWGGDLQCNLSIVDYWFNLFMWYAPLKLNEKINPCNIFWDETLQQDHIRQYLDKYAATLQNKIEYGGNGISQEICEAMYYFSLIENFALYLANTVNHEDDIELMNRCEEFKQLMHISMADVPFEDVKSVGMDYTYKIIDIIKNSESILGYEHGLTNSFKSQEGINPRQYKEVEFNIGNKPKIDGTVYPYLIDKSFKMGGVDNPLYYFIESDVGRTAQIYSKNNVGDSGDFARLLGLNNTDTILYPDPDYSCGSQNFIKYEIKTKKHLSMIKNRYYRFNPRGMERVIDENDMSLVGKTVYLRSPITCASKAAGLGICRKCYGDLYYINRFINVGKFAAEALSSELTQKLLSAKHLLETKILQIHWVEQFYKYFDIDINAITISNAMKDVDDLHKYSLVINPEDIELVNEDDYDDDDISYTEVYNEYINSFVINTPYGESFDIRTDDNTDLYISTELNNIIRKKAYNVDNMIVVPLSELVDTPMFYVPINNNELKKLMEDIMHILNKKCVTTSLNKDTASQTISDLSIDGGLHLDSIHLELILSNQIVNPNDILTRPNWNIPEVSYRLLTLNEALTNNPSVIISLLYKDLNKVLYNPLTFAKHGPSFFDLFYMEQPQKYISKDLITEDAGIEVPESGIPMIRHIEK